MDKPDAQTTGKKYVPGDRTPSFQRPAQPLKRPLETSEMRGTSPRPNTQRPSQPSKRPRQISELGGTSRRPSTQRPAQPNAHSLALLEMSSSPSVVGSPTLSDTAASTPGRSESNQRWHADAHDPATLSPDIAAILRESLLNAGLGSANNPEHSL